MIDSILKGDVQPFGGVMACPACGASSLARETRYCEWTHVRGRAGTRDGPFIDATMHGSISEPHLHLICNICGFEWLELPAWMTKQR
jgi:hypothetical protein